MTTVLVVTCAWLSLSVVFGIVWTLGAAVLRGVRLRWPQLVVDFAAHGPGGSPRGGTAGAGWAFGPSALAHRPA